MDRPFVAINVAATADGKIDTFERRGAAISSARDKERVDKLRAEAAQENLVLNLAAELKESNVTANIIQVKSIDVKGDGNPSILPSVAGRAATTPDEIVASMIYLCAEEASKITGARISLFR
jgi:NAD(P)-dependent dehydrogenase (short-subunit alcohol dehydrogenase family)